MDDIKKNKYFLLIKLNQIKFITLNNKNQIILNKEILINNLTENNNFEILENFLDQNIIEIEKKLQSYVKDIYLIVDNNDFLTIDMSSIKNFKNYLNQTNYISNLLVDLKNNLKKDMINYKIIHLLINKFIIGGKNYSSLPQGLQKENVFLEIRFICMKNIIYLKFKKIFSKYEITIKNILNYKYINNFKKSEKENIFVIANRVIDGFNRNEVLFVNKASKNKGFFEKFFDFFS